MIGGAALCLALAACGPTSAPVDESTGEPASTTTTDASPTTTSGTSTTADPSTTTTAETTASSDPSTSAAPTTDGGFIVAPDGGGCGAAFDPDREFRCTECDGFSQNCGDGLKCVAWDSTGGGSWNAHKCVMVTGDGVAGDPCTVEGEGATGVDDCAFGHMCWGVDERNHGVCVGLCTGTPRSPVCADDLVCLIANDGALNLCLPACDPLVQDCPADDHVCIANGDVFLCVPDGSGDMGAVNDPCEFLNSCDEGLACVGPQASSACEQDASGCCQPFCQFPDGACPNPDQTCQQWFDPEMGIPEGSEDIGVCSAVP